MTSPTPHFVNTRHDCTPPEFDPASPSRTAQPYPLPVVTSNTSCCPTASKGDLMTARLNCCKLWAVLEILLWHLHFGASETKYLHQYDRPQEKSFHLLQHSKDAVEHTQLDASDQSLFATWIWMGHWSCWLLYHHEACSNATKTRWHPFSHAASLAPHQTLWLCGFKISNNSRGSMTSAG